MTLIGNGIKFSSSVDATVVVAADVTRRGNSACWINFLTSAVALDEFTDE